MSCALKLGIPAVFVALSVLAGVDQCEPLPQQLRAATHLVNLTIFAMDKKGNPVGDLKPEEIEVREDSVPQKLSSFEAPDARLAPALNLETSAATGQEPSEAYKAPTTQARIIVFVVDNSATGFADRQSALAATRQWVETRLEPRDLVALVSLGMGVRIWQTFTTDRALLLSAIKAMEGENVPPAESPRVDRLLQELGRCAINSVRPEMAERCAESVATAFMSEETGVLNQRKAVLSAMIESLAGLPGEKRVVYFGDGFRTNPGRLAEKAYAMYFGDNALLMPRLNLQHDLRQVTSAALHANVTLFTIDAHGLRAVPPGGDTDELFATRSGGAFAKSDFDNELVHGTEDSLSLLAADTGGRWFYGNNDLARFADQAVGGLEGTYYASYVPTNTKFDGHYRKISIRLLRPNIVVQTRAGYFANEVSEIPLEAKVSEPTAQQGRYLVTARVLLDPQALLWNSNGEKRIDQVAVTHTLENLKGEMVSTQVDFVALSAGSPEVQMGWLLSAGHYTCTITVTEVATGNFGTTTFQAAVPAAQSGP
jgi:VWFA-related protein